MIEFAILRFHAEVRPRVHQDAGRVDVGVHDDRVLRKPGRGVLRLRDGSSKRQRGED